MIDEVQYPADPPIPVIVDTDMGSDDWLALMFLFKSPTVRVRAVTTTGTGLSHGGPAWRNLLDLAQFVGNDATLVGIGRDLPLQGDHTFPSDLRARSDSFLNIPLPRNHGPSPTESAVDILIRTIRSEKGRVSIVALGPLTNLAEAILADDEILDRIATIYVMAGALDVPGNAPNLTAEWNAYIDPKAASLVLSSSANITLVPLDATNQVPVTLDFYERLRRELKTPVAKMVFEILTAELEEIRSGEYFFWDSLAAAVSVDAKLVATEQLSVKVITEAGHDSLGRTLVVPGYNKSINVCTSVDVSAFENRFIDVISSDL